MSIKNTLIWPSIRYRKKMLINRKGKKVRVKLTSLDSHSFSSASKGTTKGDPFIVIVFTIWSSNKTCKLTNIFTFRLRLGYMVVQYWRHIIHSTWLRVRAFRAPFRATSALCQPSVGRATFSVTGLIEVQVDSVDNEPYVLRAIKHSTGQIFGQRIKTNVKFDCLKIKSCLSLTKETCLACK